MINRKTTTVLQKYVPFVHCCQFMYKENSMFVSFAINFIRRDKKQRRNQKYCEISIVWINFDFEILRVDRTSCFPYRCFRSPVVWAVTLAGVALRPPIWTIAVYLVYRTCPSLILTSMYITFLTMPRGIGSVKATVAFRDLHIIVCFKCSNVCI